MNPTCRTEAKLRFPYTSEENVEKKISEQAKQNEIRKNETMKNTAGEHFLLR